MPTSKGIKKILYFHSSIWNEFFRDLLYFYQKEHNCEVAIVSNYESKNIYKKNLDAGAEHILIPAWKDYCSNNQNSCKYNEVHDYIRFCENKTKKAISRIVLASERDIGRAFSIGYYYWPKNELQKYSLGKNDNPLRLVVGIFTFLKLLFRRFNPDLILARSNNNSLALSAWFVAQKENIPFFTCRFSKIISKRAFWTNDYNMYNTQGKKVFYEKIKKRPKLSDYSIKKIIEFNNNPEPIDYIHKNWKLFDSKKWLKKHLSILGLIKANLIYHIGGYKGQKPKPVISKIIEFYRIELMQKKHKKYFSSFSDSQLKELRYFYMPLHKEPELMLNFESPLWHDQRHAVKYISSMLPFRNKLLVKEHRFNWGRRYTNYLKYIQKLPNVELINPFDTQFKYIRNADVIVTDNGSTGWEGLLMKKPVITLEKTFYDAPGLARKVTEPFELDRHFIEVLNGNQNYSDNYYMERLGWFIDSEYETTIPIDEMHKNMSLSDNKIRKLMKRYE